MVLTISTLSRICFVQLSIKRWILSHTFKDDINNDYGIYPENEEEDIVMEVVDHNTNYEQAAVGGTSGEEETNGRQVSDYENWEDEYDKMYDDHDDQRQSRENDYDNMYDKTG